MTQFEAHEDSEESPFGAWLRAEREKKGWTQR
jgi:hypothetical protein